MKTLNKNKEKKLNKRMDELFDKDMRWTRIHQLIIIRAPITADDKDYYLEKLQEE